MTPDRTLLERIADLAQEGMATGDVRQALTVIKWAVRDHPLPPAQGIAARSDETRHAAQPERQEPGGEAMRPTPLSAIKGDDTLSIRAREMLAEEYIAADRGWMAQYAREGIDATGHMQIAVKAIVRALSTGEAG